ncbi:hypothetical protein NDU88_009164 [Pleurodeles waltl]|uniref:Uncharacterized protein n=1 Tax=Pleurodeles waltl TaxID=8319 RepID=A0AAV7PU88_PLEWA|nr:hypothetical protein NDU88_009164 [Pleurodeles waltl]
MHRSRRFQLAHVLAHAPLLRLRPAQLRATRYSEVRHPMSDIPAVLLFSAPHTAIGSYTFSFISWGSLCSALRHLRPLYAKNVV